MMVTIMNLVSFREAQALSHHTRLSTVKLCWQSYLFLGRFLPLIQIPISFIADTDVFSPFNTSLRVNTESPITTLRYHTFTVQLYHQFTWEISFSVWDTTSFSFGFLHVFVSYVPIPLFNLIFKSDCLHVGHGSFYVNHFFYFLPF